MTTTERPVYEIKLFRSKWAAERYIKFQGWTTRQAQVRMRKMPGHEWANKNGNVAIVRKGGDAGGHKYVFSNGSFQYAYVHGLRRYDA